MVTFAEGHRDDKRPEQAALTAARRGSKYGGRWRSVAETIAFLFHRAGKSVRAKYEPRFRKEQARYEHAGKKDRDVSVVARGFELSLARAAGIKKWPGGAGTALLDYAADDPTWVLSQLLLHPKNPCTVRTIAIAGLAGMKGLAAREFTPSSSVLATSA
jgi:hypothetical protein